MDVGAYPIYPWGQILEPLGTPAILPGPYDVRNYRYVTHALASNKGPEGAYRGVGRNHEPAPVVPGTEAGSAFAAIHVGDARTHR